MLPVGRLTALLALALLFFAACDDDTESTEATLVFDSEQDGTLDIYTVRTDGTELTPLLAEDSSDYEPNPAPDSTIVFASDRAGDGNRHLFLMNRNGGDIRQLTYYSLQDGTVTDDYAHWSHDGRQIVFQRTTTGPEKKTDANIWLIDPRSGEETQLTDTPDHWDSTPSFAADNASVLFESNRDGDFDIYRLDLGSGELTQLTNEPGMDIESGESHDGSQIIFASDRDGDYEVFVMDPDGSDARPLTDNESTDRCPHGSPDGTRISFVSNRDADDEIYVMNSDGSEPRRLTNNPGRDATPNWLE